MLKYNNKNVAVLKVQAVNDRQGNPRKAYIVNDLDTYNTLLITDDEGAIKELLPLFEKPNFHVNIEVKELLRILNVTRYLENT